MPKSILFNADDRGLSQEIHKRSYNGTSSEGFQTIHPDQWPSFIAMSMDLAKCYYGEKWDKTIIPYILIEA